MFLLGCLGINGALDTKVGRGNNAIQMLRLSGKEHDNESKKSLFNFS
jgi:hypothetical protein